jgi:hypothetical protein
VLTRSAKNPAERHRQRSCSGDGLTCGPSFLHRPAPSAKLYAEDTAADPSNQRHRSRGHQHYPLLVAAQGHPDDVVDVITAELERLIVIYLLAACGESTGWRSSITPHSQMLIPACKPSHFSATAAAKFRITHDPPGYQDFVVSDGVKEVDSDRGLLDYAPTVHNTFIVGTGDLPTVCPEARRVGRIEVVSRAANRYACKPPEVDQFLEVTIDSDNGILLAATSKPSAIYATAST